MTTPLALPPSTDEPSVSTGMGVPTLGNPATGLSLTHDEDDAAPADHALRRIAMFSVLTIVLGFGGLVTWASLARLDSAVPANGVIISAGRRKTITLNEGGILAQLLVKEGDKVAAGQLLLRLDDIQASAADDQAAAQYWGTVAQAARLKAEAADSHELEFPEDLRRAEVNPSVAAVVETERHVFETRWSAFQAVREVAARRIAQQQAAAAALQVQQREVAYRLNIFDSELAGVRELFAKGFATRLRVNQLERSESEMRALQADLVGRTAQTQQLIAQTELEMISSRQTRHSDINRDLEAAEARMADAAGRYRASQDRLDKRNVHAPEAGTITDIKYFTPGSNVAAGQQLMDLVPLDPRLLVEADVAPTDIEHVRVGQKVNVRLTAYKAHQVPVITGHLVYVSPDRQMTPQNEPAYKVRAELDEKALDGLPDVAIIAGMPADVLIIGRERTALSYLISPIRDSIHHAMREE